MTENEFVKRVETIMWRALSDAEIGWVTDCFNAGWSVDRVVAALNI